VKVSNSYKYVVLKGTSGSIDVRGSSSPIEVSNIRKLPEDARIDLVTTYKPITLTLPENADVAVSANSEYGKIRSDFPVYLNGDEKGARLELGKASVTVHLKTSSNIILKKE
jgi:DUF4097 and DUF4098 domain-containing protein YvlB